MTIKIKNNKTYKNQVLPIFIKKYHKFRKLYLLILVFMTDHLVLNSNKIYG